jgi:hypothetical protein
MIAVYLFRKDYCGIISKNPPETKRKQNNLVFNHIHVLRMPMLSLKDYFIYNQPEEYSVKR